MTDREYKRKLAQIRHRGRQKEMRDKLQKEKEKFFPKPERKVNNSKAALWYIMASCTIVQAYSMIAMWHFADLSPLITLIGATVGEAISYCAYAAKSTKENTEGGITFEMAMIEAGKDPDLEIIDLNKEAKG